MNENDSQPQATTDPASAVYAREPGHSHAADQPCHPEACTGHPDWKFVGTTDGPVLARPNDPATRAQVSGLEGRVTALENHVHVRHEERLNALEQAPDTDDRDEPCETADGPYGRLSAELAEARDDRRTRAEAMLGTAETVKATGGAAEIGGVRLERCDEYGRTETTGRLERVIRERDAADRALNVNRREVSALLEKLEKARAERDEAREGCATHLRWLEDRDGELDQVRTERDAALAGAESAETELADARETLARTRAELDQPRLGCATTDQLIAELYARAKVAGAIGESWPTYRTVEVIDP